MFFHYKKIYMWGAKVQESSSTSYLTNPYIYGAKNLKQKLWEQSKRDGSAVIWKVSGLLNQNYQELLAGAILTLDNRIFSKYIVTVLKTVVNKWRQTEYLSLSLCLHAFLSIIITKRHNTLSSYNHSWTFVKILTIRDKWCTVFK